MCKSKAVKQFLIDQIISDLAHFPKYIFIGTLKCVVILMVEHKTVLNFKLLNPNIS